MRIIFEIGHPAHVHQFKYTIWNLMNKGHDIKIVAKDKDIAVYLLNIYGIEYENIGKHYMGLIGKGFGLIKTDYRLLKIAKKFKPDLFISRASPYSAHISRLMMKPHLAFCDTEYAVLNDMLAYPFTDTICTPTCFRRDLGKKQVMFNGYKELGYLHPNHFKPDIGVLEDLNLSKNDKFIILRFISWGASHDMGLQGIKKGSEIEFIKSLEQHGQVFITSEKKLNQKIEKYRLSVTPEKMHSLLSFASLYIGEGGTMAVESAILGTPSIHIEYGDPNKPSASSMFCGNFIELRDKYDLLYMFPEQDKALEKAISILENKNSKQEWQKKKEKLLNDKIDVTAWMTDFIERYPESFYEYKNKEKK